MWLTLMVVFLAAAQVSWLAATAFVRSRGYHGNYAMKTGIAQRNETWTSLKAISNEGRPADQRKAKTFFFLMIASYIAGFACFLAMLQNR